jgi:ubiquinone/menaquinone biosynthesis C-methylase UbiE
VTDYLADISTSYDTVAPSYAELVVTGADWEDHAFDLLTELLPGDSRAVLDVGCGPGRTTGLLAARELQVVGIDLSPGMIEVARRDHPELDFRVGSMTALDVPDDSVAGVCRGGRSSTFPATSFRRRSPSSTASSRQVASC